mgnify:CR=1 FL=1
MLLRLSRVLCDDALLPVYELGALLSLLRDERVDPDVTLVRVVLDDLESPLLVLLRVYDDRLLRLLFVYDVRVSLLSTEDRPVLLL